MSLNRALKQELIRTKLSVSEIVELTGLGYGTVWQILKEGGVNFRIETAEALAKVCNKKIVLEDK